LEWRRRRILSRRKLRCAAGRIGEAAFAFIRWENPVCPVIYLRSKLLPKSTNTSAKVFKEA
jgi:hypothetical protein